MDPGCPVGLYSPAGGQYILAIERAGPWGLLRAFKCDGTLRSNG